MTEINLRDESAGLEYSLECDIEKGELHGWHVVCVNPMPLQAAFNVPFLNRPAGVSTPCSQKAAAEVPVRKAVRIGADRQPIERK